MRAESYERKDEDLRSVKAKIAFCNVCIISLGGNDNFPSLRVRSTQPL